MGKTKAGKKGSSWANQHFKAIASDAMTIVVGLTQRSMEVSVYATSPSCG